MKLHKTKYKALFFFATFFLSPYIQAGEGFMYGSVSNSDGGVWIKLKLELCSPPPSPITVVFDDGSIGKVEIDKKWIAIMDKRGQTKQDAEETKHIYGEFVPKYCSVKYVSKEQKSKKAILAVLNSSKIKAKKITDWKIVKYKDLDKNVLLKAKPLNKMREQMRIGKWLEVEFCDVSWSLEKASLVYGYKDKSEPLSSRVGAPVLDFQEKCQGKVWGKILHVSCNPSPEPTSERVFSLIYIDGKCVSPSRYDLKYLAKEDIPEVWGEIEIDNKNFYVVKQVLSDVLHLRDVFLINLDVSGIYDNYLTPPPSSETQ